MLHLTIFSSTLTSVPTPGHFFRSAVVQKVTNKWMRLIPERVLELLFILLLPFTLAQQLPVAAKAKGLGAWGNWFHLLSWWLPFLDPVWDWQATPESLQGGKYSVWNYKGSCIRAGQMNKTITGVGVFFWCLCNHMWTEVAGIMGMSGQIVTSVLPAPYLSPLPTFLQKQ